MKKGGESQTREGWMVRHHQHLPCLGGMQGWLVRGVTTIHASWLSHPTGNGCRGSEMRPRAPVHVCPAYSTFSSVFNRFGFARMVPLRTLGCEPSPPPDDNDSHSGASQLHPPCEGFHTRGAVWRVHPHDPSRFPHVYYAPLEPFPTWSGISAPTRAHSVPHLPCGRVARKAQANLAVSHHSSTRATDHHVPLGTPSSLPEWDTRSGSGSLGYVPLMGCASPPPHARSG